MASAVHQPTTPITISNEQLELPFRPELLPGLLNVISANAEARFIAPSPDASLALRRALHVLNQILKEISAIKIPSGVQFMGTVSPTCF
jgi:hypothetical protein